MAWTATDVAARARRALVVAIVAGLALLAAATVDPTAGPQTAVVLAALSSAASFAAVHCLLAVPGAGIHSLRPPRRSAHVPLVLAGRTTDVVHHPVRPRAPGLV
jgi:hypothetical protein